MHKRRYKEDNYRRREEPVKKAVIVENIYESATRKSRLLAKDEFDIITGKISYNEYFARYYEIWVKEMLIDGLLDKQWYKERNLWTLVGYPDTFMEFRDFIANKPGDIRLLCENTQSLISTELFDRIKSDSPEKDPVVIIKNIKESTSIDAIVEEISQDVGLVEYAVSQGDMYENYTKTMYIITEIEEKDAIEVLSKKSILKDSMVFIQYLPCATSSKFIRKAGKQFNDKYVLAAAEKQSRAILERMSELLKVPEVYTTIASLETRVRPEEIADLYILALRKVFNFCYYCGIKYDNVYEMVFKCGVYHVRNMHALDESNTDEHMKKMQDSFMLDRVNFLKAVPRSIDIRTFCAETKEKDGIECKYCDKKFEHLEFFKKHLERKNHREYEKSVNLHNEFLKCIESLNYQLINGVEKRNHIVPSELYKYIINSKFNRESEVNYSDLDKKYPVLQTNMPISVGVFEQGDL